MGQKIKEGLKLEEMVKDQLVYSFPVRLGRKLPNYKHFTKNFQKIIEMTELSGDCNEEAIQSFVEILPRPRGRAKRTSISIWAYFSNGSNRNHHWCRFYLMITSFYDSGKYSPVYTDIYPGTWNFFYFIGL